jgi:hypothetical protein
MFHIVSSIARDINVMHRAAEVEQDITSKKAELESRKKLLEERRRMLSEIKLREAAEDNEYNNERFESRDDSDDDNNYAAGNDEFYGSESTQASPSSSFLSFIQPPQITPSETAEAEIKALSEQVLILYYLIVVYNCVDFSVLTNYC